MCNHNWDAEIDIATGEVSVYACTRCGEEREPDRRVRI